MSDLKKEIEELEKMFEGFWETAKMTKALNADQFIETEYGLGDKKERDKNLYRVGHSAGTEEHYRDILWRLKKALGKDYAWLRDGAYCPGCRTGGLYG